MLKFIKKQFDMRIYKFPKNKQIYSSNIYLIRGDFNKLSDINTLIDTGGDDSVSQKIGAINTGVGKTAVEQIILTHSHFDHTGGIKSLINRYNPKIYSFSTTKEYFIKIHDSDKLKVGDSFGQIIHAPFHSTDSVCIYFAKEKVIFTGDLQLVFITKTFDISHEYIDFLNFLLKLDLDIIYPGHGDPISGNIKNILTNSISNCKTK